MKSQLAGYRAARGKSSRAPRSQSRIAITSAFDRGAYTPWLLQAVDLMRAMLRGGRG